MKSSLSYNVTFDHPARYQIKVKGRIPGSWSDRLGGMSVVRIDNVDGNLISTLEGDLADQVALAGVISTLNTIQLPIILVESIKKGGSS